MGWGVIVGIILIITILAATLFVAPVHCCTYWERNESTNTTTVSEKQCDTPYAWIKDGHQDCGIKPPGETP